MSNPNCCHLCLHKKHHTDIQWCKIVTTEPTAICIHHTGLLSTVGIRDLRLKMKSPFEHYEAGDDPTKPV